MKLSAPNTSHYRDKSHFPSDLEETFLKGTHQKRIEMNNRIFATLAAQSLGEFQALRKEIYGDRPALRGIYETTTGIALTETLSYSGLDRKIELAAAALRASGLEQGDCLCVISENNVNEFILVEACHRIGAYALQWTSAVQSAGLRAAEVIEKSKPKLVAMTDGQLLKAHLKEAYSSGQFPVLNQVVDADMIIKIGNEVGNISFPRTIQLHDADRCPPVNVDIHDTAYLMFSSGTGGAAPKAIEISHASVLYQLSVGPAALDQPPGEACLDVLPDIHVYGTMMKRLLLSGGQNVTTADPRLLRDHGKETVATGPYACVNVVPAIIKGMRLGVQRGLHAARLDKSSIRKRIEAWFAWCIEREVSPAMREHARANLRSSKDMDPILHEANEEYWGGLLNGHSAILDALSPTRFARHFFGKTMTHASLQEMAFSINGGGTAAPYDIAFFDALSGGKWKKKTGYGQTETTGGVTAPAPEADDPAVMAGRLLPGMVAFEHPIADVAGTGKAGSELCLIGPAIARYRDKELQEKRIPEGVLHTGDTVRVVPIKNGMREDLAFLFISRINRMKKVYGDSIALEPLEDKLKGHDYVQEVLVTGNDIDLLGAIIEPSDILRRNTKNNKTKMRAILQALTQELTGRETTGQRAWVTRVHIVDKFENTPEYKIITDSQKLIPPEVERKYAKEIEEMWHESLKDAA